MAKLMWDVKTDTNKAIDEFHLAYYGKAAGPMRAYFDLMHRGVRMPPEGEGHHVWIYDRPSAPYLNEEFLAKATSLFAQAEAAAESDAVRARVRKARLAIDYVKLTRAKKFTVEGDTYRPTDLSRLEDRWNTFVAAVRGFGITHLAESTIVTNDDKDFNTFMRPYRVVTLENERLRIHVVPELGGRVTHMIDKRSGRDLLQHPEPAAKQYPNLGGLTVAAYDDYVSRLPWAARWEAESGASSDAVTLSGTSSNGLRLTRRLRLDGAFLRTETVLENATAAPVEAAAPIPLGSGPGRPREGCGGVPEAGRGIGREAVDPTGEAAHRHRILQWRGATRGRVARGEQRRRSGEDQPLPERPGYPLLSELDGQERKPRGNGGGFGTAEARTGRASQSPGGLRRGVRHRAPAVTQPFLQGVIVT